MKAFVATITFIASLAAALPALQARDGICSALLYSVPQCCQTDVLGLADLDCQSPSSANDAEDFKNSCESGEAMCCSVPVAGQALLCTSVE